MAEKHTLADLARLRSAAGTTPDAPQAQPQEPKVDALGRAVLRKLHIYKGAEHPHAGAQPAKLDIAAMNRKNSVAEASVD